MRKQNIQAKRSIRCTQSVAKRRGQNKTFEASTASFPRNWTANRSAIFAFGVQSCWIHHGGVLKIDLYNFLKYSQFHTVAHNCHGKTKTLTAKTKTSRQNQKPHGKNKIPHGKTKNLKAKTKYLTTKPNLTAKPKTSRQNQILHSKNQIPHGKSKAKLFWFCCEVFGFAERFLVLP